MKPNRMKEKMTRGEPALGCSVMFPSPQVVEMLGYAGFDWVLIDCEHGSIGLADVELMAMAADAVGITAIARPRTNAVSDIQAVMDRGVMGVQVPHVNTAEEARRTVAAVKFGAGAQRGLAVGTRLIKPHSTSGAKEAVGNQVPDVQGGTALWTARSSSQFGEQCLQREELFVAQDAQLLGLHHHDVGLRLLDLARVVALGAPNVAPPSKRKAPRVAWIG